MVVDIYWTNMSDCLTSIGFEKRFWFITAFWDMKASFSRGSYIYLWDAWNTLFLLQHSHLIITTILASCYWGCEQLTVFVCKPLALHSCFSNENYFSQKYLNFSFCGLIDFVEMVQLLTVGHWQTTRTALMSINHSRLATNILPPTYFLDFHFCELGICRTFGPWKPSARQAL